MTANPDPLPRGDDAAAPASARLTAFANGVTWPESDGITIGKYWPLIAGTHIPASMVMEDWEDDASILANYPTLSQAQIDTARAYCERHSALYEAQNWLDYMGENQFPGYEGDQMETLRGDVRAILDALSTAERAATAAQAERHTLLVALWRTTKGWIKAPGKRPRADLPPSQPTCRHCKAVFQHSSGDLSWHEPDCPVVISCARIYDEAGNYRPEFQHLAKRQRTGRGARGLAATPAPGGTPTPAGAGRQGSEAG